MASDDVDVLRCADEVIQSRNDENKANSTKVQGSISILETVTNWTARLGCSKRFQGSNLLEYIGFRRCMVGLITWQP